MREAFHVLWNVELVSTSLDCYHSADYTFILSFSAFSLFANFYNSYFLRTDIKDQGQIFFQKFFLYLVISFWLEYDTHLINFCKIHLWLNYVSKKKCYHIKRITWLNVLLPDFWIHNCEDSYLEYRKYDQSLGRSSIFQPLFTSPQFSWEALRVGLVLNLGWSQSQEAELTLCNVSDLISQVFWKVLWLNAVVLAYPLKATGGNNETVAWYSMLQIPRSCCIVKQATSLL